MIRFHMQFDFGFYECRLNSACRFFAPLPSMIICRCIEYGTAAGNARVGHPVNVNRPAMRERLQKIPILRGTK